MTRLAAALVGCAVLAVAPAAAQGLDPGPPGPYVVDVRGAVSGLPSAFVLLPGAPAGAVAPARALGVAVGAHVYPFSIGPARIGLGAGVLHARAAATPPGADVPETRTRITMIAPEVSLNFGTGDGWSYLSGGAGWGRVSAALGDVAADLRAETGWGAAVNYGGGARWFLGRHLAVGFDVRAHQLQSRQVLGGAVRLPRTTLVTASVGISLR